MANYVEIFNNSYIRLLGANGRGEDFLRAFYDRFMASSPEVREKFKTSNMRRQRRVLRTSIYVLMHFFSSKQDNENLRELACLHSQADRDIPPHLYSLWLDCLIETVEEMDPKYDRDVGLAWKLVMGVGIAYMQDMYDR